MASKLEGAHPPGAHQFGGPKISRLSDLLLTITLRVELTFNMLQTAIAINQDTPHILLAALTWYKQGKPDFSTRRMTLPFMRQNFLSVVVVNNVDLTSAIDAACNRTVETLLIRRHLRPGAKLGIEILVKPALSKATFPFPIEAKKHHWLLTAAETALDAWLRGE